MLLHGVNADIDALLEGGEMVSPQALLGLQERLYLVSPGAAGELPAIEGPRAALG